MAAQVSIAMAPKRVHVDVCVRPESAVEFDLVRHAALALVQHSALVNGAVAFDNDPLLAEHVERIAIVDLDDDEHDAIDTSDQYHASGATQFLIHVYKLSDEPLAEETADDDESVSTRNELSLPSRSLDGLWDSLVFDAAVKRRVLDYASTAMRFADAHVNPHIVSWNRVVLLHGPPGTGKTSLCKALAQKLSIRLSDRYANAFLLEINAHSLFSKWFSESGKLVMKLFRQIQDLVEDDDALVCVLIDEVESLSAARRAALSGSEPSDAIRVVNALLTQLDALKQFANVLVLTTSNITEAIDVAFVDRADIKQYIGLPSIEARYEILRSCVNELHRVQLVVDATSSSSALLTFRDLQRRRASKKRVAEQMDAAATDHAVGSSDCDIELSIALLQVADATDGFSGRALRKLPFQAHAFFVQTGAPTTLEFVQSLVRTAALEVEQTKRLASG